MKEFFCTAPGETPIVIEAILPSFPARLFQAWTKPEELRQWFGQDPQDLNDIQIDLREGGYWRFMMQPGNAKEQYLEGEYLEIQPNEKLAFTWSHVVLMPNGAFRRTPPSTVTLRFEALGAATRLLLEHRAILSADGRFGVRKGWIASFQALTRWCEPVTKPTAV